MGSEREADRYRPRGLIVGKSKRSGSENRARDEVVSVRLMPAEKAKLEDAAAKLGLSVAALLRQAGLDQAVELRRVPLHSGSRVNP